MDNKFWIIIRKKVGTMWEKEDWGKAREKGMLRYILKSYVLPTMLISILLPIFDLLIDYLWFDFNWPGITVFFNKNDINNNHFHSNEFLIGSYYMVY